MELLKVVAIPCLGNPRSFLLVLFKTEPPKWRQKLPSYAFESFHIFRSRPHKIATSLPCCLAYFKVTVLLDLYKYIYIIIYSQAQVGTPLTSPARPLTRKLSRQRAWRTWIMSLMAPGAAWCRWIWWAIWWFFSFFEKGWLLKGGPTFGKGYWREMMDQGLGMKDEFGQGPWLGS